MSSTNPPEPSEYRRASRSVRSAVGTVILLLSAVLGFNFMTGQSMGSTDAMWHASDSATADFEAATIPAPELTRECRYRPGALGLGARVEIYWSAPEGYTLDDAELVASSAGLGSILEPITGFNFNSRTEGSPAEYTTTIPTGLLGGLLGLGTELEAAIYVSDNDWTSESASVIANPGIVGGLGGSCRNQVGQP